MDFMILLKWVAGVEILIAGIGSVVFAASYASYFNWRKTEAGRSLMYFVLSLSAFFAVALLGTGFRGTFAFAVLRVILYTGLMATMWHLVYVLWTSHRRKEHFIDNPTRKEHDAVTD